jgi:hypothetical protein
MRLALLLSFSLNCLAFDHNHNQWSKFLDKFLVRKGKQTLIQYRNILKKPQLLQSYLNELEDVSLAEFKNFSKDQRLSFWINAYNAYTIKLVSDHYPVKSIREIKSGFFSGLLGLGPWKKDFIRLFGKKYSLDDIEHQIIRKRFKEPRIHFALNCGSYSCPSLHDKPFRAKDLDQELDNAMMNFLTNKNKNYYKNQILYISKIFDWYSSDFKPYGGYQKLIKVKLKINKDVEFEFLPYNWDLNEYKD